RFLEGFGLRLTVNESGVRPAAFARVLERAAGRPEARLIKTILLRSMTQARYAPENLGHFGLASTCYTHFTSPIRRYPDLIIHRILDRALEGKKLKPSEREDSLSYLQEAGKHTS